VLATGIAFVSITIGGRVYTRMSRQIVVVHQ
jgi:hypothetical protein